MISAGDGTQIFTANLAGGCRCHRDTFVNTGISRHLPILVLAFAMLARVTESGFILFRLRGRYA